MWSPRPPPDIGQGDPRRPAAREGAEGGWEKEALQQEEGGYGAQRGDAQAYSVGHPPGRFGAPAPEE